MKKQESHVGILSGSLSTFVFIAVMGVVALLIYLTLGESLKKEMRELAVIEANVTHSSEIETAEMLPGEFVPDEYVHVVERACTSCHSSQLVTQNRANRDGWKKMIRWMQETQGLPELGLSEVLILDYLAKNYGPKKQSRRANLQLVEDDWYELEL